MQRLTGIKERSKGKSEKDKKSAKKVEIFIALEDSLFLFRHEVVFHRSSRRH